MMPFLQFQLCGLAWELSFDCFIGSCMLGGRLAPFVGLSAQVGGGVGVAF